MKYAVILFFTSLSFSLFAQHTIKDNSLFPLAIGNYWVYGSTIYPERFDTIKVIQHKVIGSDTAFVLANVPIRYDAPVGSTPFLWFPWTNSNLLYEHNDSIYSFLQYNDFVKWVEYFPVDTLTTYLAFHESDLGFERTASYVGNYSMNGKTYCNCYKYSEYHDEITIVCKNIGIVERTWNNNKIYLVTSFLNN
jgi:hypothetical protein